MYIHISNLTNGKELQLLRCIDNPHGNLEIALCEILYYPGWYNISRNLQNNKFVENGQTVTIPDGYYNVCTLNEFFKDHGCKVSINSANGCLKIEVLEDGIEIVLERLLANTLGFVPGKLTRKLNFGDFIPKLVTHKEVFVHLDCLNTSDTLFGETPSTLLRMISVGNENYNSGRYEIFPNLQYKKLKKGLIPNMTIRVLDTYNEKIDMWYVSLTLHLKVCGT